MDYSKSSNYLICKLYGFKNLTIMENKNYPIKNELIKSIKLNDNLESIQIELKDGITYTGHEDEIKSYLYHICFNLIIRTEVFYTMPMYSIDLIHENNKDLKAKDILNIRGVCEIRRDYSADDIYYKITNSSTNIEKNIMKYERIFKTLHNPNKIVQFMSLYQFLMELLQGDKEYPSQKNVTEYLRKKEKEYDFISFKKTRKKGQNFDEDYFTYKRNEIGHSEETNDLNLYRKLGSEIDQQTIKNLVIVINDVIMNEN